MLYPLSYGGGRTSATHCALIEMFKDVIRIANQLRDYKNLVCDRRPSTKILKSQIPKHKYQMVRQAHHPEPTCREPQGRTSRRANHNDRNSKYQTCLGH